MAEKTKQDPVRSLSNRIFLRISGKWFRAYSVVRHVGRTTGLQYRNPVSAYPLGDGFVIAVLYGIESNWVRNVMAAGRFALQTKGRDYLLERPEIIAPAQALPAYPALYRRMVRTRNIQHFVWAHRAPAVHREPDPGMSGQREKVRFASGDTECAAWHYPGANGAGRWPGQARDLGLLALINRRQSDER